MFDRDVADLVQEERIHWDYDMDAMYIAKAAEIVRLGMFIIPLVGHFHPTARQTSYIHH